MITNLLKQGQLLDRLHCLIRRKATGTPKSLAEKLGVNERTIYRLIEEMKDCCFPIEYSTERVSYYYTYHCDFRPPQIIILGNDANQKFKGGRKNYFFQPFFPH